MNSLAVTTAPTTPPPGASIPPGADSATGSAPVGPADFFAVFSGVSSGARDSANATEAEASPTGPTDSGQADETETDPADADPSGAPAMLAFAWPPHLMPPPPPPPPPTPPPPSATGDGPATRESDFKLQLFACPPVDPAPVATGFPVSAAPATAAAPTDLAPASAATASDAASAATEPVSAAGEKLAAALDQLPEAPSPQGSGRRLGNFLPFHHEALTKGANPLGTEDANASFTMPAHRFSSASTDAPAPGRRMAPESPASALDDASRASSANEAASPDDSATPFATTALPSSATALSSPAPHAAAAGPADATVPATSASAADGSRETARELSGAAGDAVAAIGEVVELTHEFRARERSSVEVKFHFADDTDLSVRVACRAGEVSVEFHTDSPELRATLGREWQERIGATSAALETRGLRLADPVFSAAAPTATADGDAAGAPPSDQHSGAQDSHHRATNGGTDPLAPLGRALRGLGAAARGAFAPAGAPAAAWLRPDTVRHLLAFA